MSAIPPPQAPGSPQPQAPVAQQQQQGLPPTGLQQQLQSLNSFYGRVQQAQSGGPFGGHVGYNVRGQQFGAAQQQEDQGQLDEQQFGSNTLEGMARNLAQRYGMPIGRGRLMDDQGNFLMTPDQLANASGGAMTLGEAAAKMNYISQAVTKKQNEDQQQKGIASMQAGLGQVQSRGRGSLAGMMSGYYEGIADLYANQEYEAADFSFYIQKEQLDIQNELQRRAEKLSKKNAQGQFVAGIGVTIASIYTGNIAGVGAGVAMAGGAAGSTGWF